MARISRRSFMTAAASAVAYSLPGMNRPALAATAVRYDVTTSEGLAMLKIYADAVGKMMAMNAGDPTGWTFQWYTHAVPSDRTKASEIARIYPNSSDPRRAIATAMWDTCESHTDMDGTRQDYFLPWHRMYVSYLEDIVRSVTGKPDFTLPYWNYTEPGQRALPIQFRSPTDPTWKSLHRSARKAGVNDGRPIDSLPGALPINISAMRSPGYRDSAGDAGFCANIDNAPHGAVHVDVGNARGMGQVPWAANDPIFWLHHCNIDRIWASWNKAGGQNPSNETFLKEQFTFANGSGNAIVAKVRDWLDTTGYSYDRYLQRPPGSVPFPAPGALVASSPQVILATTSKIGLGTAATKIALTAAVPGALPNPTAVDDALRSAEGADVYLRLNGVVGGPDPGASYDVFLAPSGGAAPARDSRSFVGTLSLFGAGLHGAHRQGSSPPKGRNYSFLVTEQIDRLRDQNPRDRIAVLLVPVAGSRSGDVPTIASISLVKT